MNLPPHVGKKLHWFDRSVKFCILMQNGSDGFDPTDCKNCISRDTRWRTATIWVHHVSLGLKYNASVIANWTLLKIQLQIHLCEGFDLRFEEKWGFEIWLKDFNPFLGRFRLKICPSLAVWHGWDYWQHPAHVGVVTGSVWPSSSVGEFF